MGTRCEAETAPRGSYVARCPMVNRFGRALAIEDAWLNGHVFLVLGGPSLNELPLERLFQRGIITFAVNNVAAWLRPNLWTYGDKTLKFHDAVWKDPGILKLAPFPKLNDKIREKLPDGRFVTISRSARDMPGVVGVRRNSVFRPDKWLYEDTVNWGHGKDGILHYGAEWLQAHRPEVVGRRDAHEVLLAERWRMSEEDRARYAPFAKVLSTFPQALRLCYFLGFRDVYLLGCDFHMSAARYYAFPQQKHEGAIGSNNNAYANLNAMFAALRPHFDAANFRVWNCYSESGLTAFDHLSFEEAAARATLGIVPEPDTAGWYDDKPLEED